jgi:putative SOS response-associated peptidase YedK
MCNEQRRRVALGQIRDDFSQTGIPLRFPEGLPNLPPLDSIRITDPNAIIRQAARRTSEAGAAESPEQARESLQGGRPAPEAPGATGSGRAAPFEAELVLRRWSWPGPSGKPVYNYRSDGREFGKGRCLIVADGFYEFTAPLDPAKKRKDKWLFTKADEGWFCIAGLWRTTAEVGEAYTMLTCPPGPDVAPFHHRQVCVLHRAEWARWLDPAVPAADILGPLSDGTLKVEKVG